MGFNSGFKGLSQTLSFHFSYPVYFSTLFPCKSRPPWNQCQVAICRAWSEKYSPSEKYSKHNFCMKSNVVRSSNSILSQNAWSFCSSPCRKLLINFHSFSYFTWHKFLLQLHKISTPPSIFSSAVCTETCKLLQSSSWFKQSCALFISTVLM